MNNSKQKQPPIGTPPTEGALFRSISLSIAAPPSTLFGYNYAETSKSATNQSIIHKSYSTPLALVTHDASWTWKLAEDQQLRPVPLYHPLERTSLVISDLTAATIMARISDFFKAQSIQAVYSKKHVGRVDCWTDQLVKFTVQLWQSAPNTITVEIQRRQGCCIRMHGIRHELTQAVLHGQTPGDAKPKPKRSSCDFVRQWVQKQTPTISEASSCIPLALRLCQEWLSSPRLDQHRLALESLCVLTDPNKAMDARAAADVLWRQPRWKELLGPYLFNAGCRQSGYGNGDNYDDSSDDLQLLALKVLVQTLEFVVWDASRRGTVLEYSTDAATGTASFWKAVRSSLQSYVRVAANQPILAALSTRALHSLHILHPYNDVEELYKSLQRAHIYGKERHQGLEQETERLMGRLVGQEWYCSHKHVKSVQAKT